MEEDYEEGPMADPAVWKAFTLVFAVLFLAATYWIWHLNTELVQADYIGDILSTAPGARGVKYPPYTIIEKGNITIGFKTTNDDVILWYVPLQTYLAYSNQPRPSQYLTLQRVAGGAEVRVPDYRAYVRPEMFSEVIGTLTAERTDRQFVNEVFNLRKQLTTYGNPYGIENVTNWPIETLTNTIGTCRDFTVLMASLLEAGNQNAGYGMTISIVYVDTDDISDPVNPNHVLIMVQYSDGVTQCIESTSATDICPYQVINGWSYDLE